MANVPGGKADNVIIGTAKGDFIFGSVRNDFIFAGAGNDTVNGYGGKDSLYGAAGHDYIDGGDGNDYLVGGEGRDSLEGSMGNDWLFGGSGTDTFFFYSRNGGRDVIADFDYAKDSIYFSAFRSAAAVTAASKQVGHDVLIKFDANNSVLVLNTTVFEVGDSII